MSKYLVLIVLFATAILTGCASGDPRRQPDNRGFTTPSDATLGPLKQHDASAFEPPRPKVDVPGADPIAALIRHDAAHPVMPQADAALGLALLERQHPLVKGTGCDWRCARLDKALSRVDARHPVVKIAGRYAYTDCAWVSAQGLDCDSFE